MEGLPNAALSSTFELIISSHDFSSVLTVSVSPELMTTSASAVAYLRVTVSRLILVQTSDRPNARLDQLRICLRCHLGLQFFFCQPQALGNCKAAEIKLPNGLEPSDLAHGLCPELLGLGLGLCRQPALFCVDLFAGLAFDRFDLSLCARQFCLDLCQPCQRSLLLFFCFDQLGPDHLALSLESI